MEKRKKTPDIITLVHLLISSYHVAHSDAERKREKQFRESSLPQLFNNAKPFLAVILVQFGYAVMSIIAKFALDQGMSPHVLVAYRMAVASALIAPFAIVLERKSRPKMTLTIFAKIMLISLFEPVLNHNLYYTGLKYTTATFTTAMCNMLPTFTFAMACIFKLEGVEIRRVHSQAKVVGTMVTVGGAMVMTLIKGPALELPWIKGRNHPDQSGASGDHEHDLMKGTLMLMAGCCCWSCFIISQAVILKSYPAKFSLAALICTMGTVEGTILAFAVEWRNTAVWLFHLDSKFIAALYGGMISAFAISTLGSVMIGSIIIVIGLYLVLWGKSKDQTQSKPDSVLAQADQQMATINGHTETPAAEFITVDANRGTPLEESD